jgi:RNA-directed DNA polymerase
MNQLISETQKRLSCWAMENPTEQRRELYNLLYHDDWIRQAHDTVKQNAGSVTAGCDGITMELFDKDLEGNLHKLQEELQANIFEPYPGRRVYIPKDISRTKWRPLGIPSIQDRIVQEALRMVLEPIFEVDFSQYSYGFRPTRCPMDAIKCMTWATQESKKFFWVVEGDISAYFDTINHRKLVKLLQRRIADKDVIALVWKFLRAGVMEKKLFRDTQRGTPQGGIASPLFANIYLHELDTYMEN